MAQHYRYTDTERATALSVLDSNGGSSEKAAKETGFPRQTIDNWKRGEVNREVPFLRLKAGDELIKTLRQKIDLLVYAIDGEKIAIAPLVGVTTALGTLIDTVHALETRNAITPEQLEEREAHYARVIAAHVTDPATLDKIAADLRRTGGADSEPVAPADPQSDV